MKYFTIILGIGKCKYTVSYHDGIKRHNDGSLFEDIQIFKNKKALNKFIKGLEKEGFGTYFDDGKYYRLGGYINL